MGIYDRDYNRADQGYRKVTIAMPPFTSGVKLLIMINAAVFLLMNLGAAEQLAKLMCVIPSSLFMKLQVWRLVTYQFVHGDFMHIFFNMLMLYFFGPQLEARWGTKKFLIFYLSCGIVGGLSYILLVSFNLLKVGFLLGASGSILGLLGAVTILNPKAKVYIYFVLPIPLYVLSSVYLFLYVMNISSQGTNAGGDAAHLGGLLAGAGYIFFFELRGKKIDFGVVDKFKSSFEKTKIDSTNLQLEVDRILKKVHDYGIQSLNSKEKRILKEATKREQMRH